LQASHARGSLDCIVVDNASGDGTPARVRESEPWVELIDAGENLGFGRACNLGAARVETPYILFLNPDATLPAEALETLVAFLDEHPQAGIVAPAIREPEGGLQLAGGIPTPWRVVRAAAGLPNSYPGRRAVVPGDAAFETDWVCGAVLLIRRELFEALEGFDPRFFLYFEETDLCLRAARHGAQLWAVGAAVATHENAASAVTAKSDFYRDCIAEHFFQSRYYFLVKHHGRFRAAFAELAEVAATALNSLLRRLTGRGVGDVGIRLRSPILELPPRRE
jgi:GT2 family glycosyltransferase